MLRISALRPSRAEQAEPGGPADEQVGDGVSVALEHGVEGDADGVPAAAAVPEVVGRGDGAVAVGVEVEIDDQLIAGAARVGAAHADEADGECGVVRGRARRGGFAVAVEVVADGVQLFERAYFDQPVAVGVVVHRRRSLDQRLRQRIDGGGAVVIRACAIHRLVEPGGSAASPDDKGRSQVIARVRRAVGVGTGPNSGDSWPGFGTGPGSPFSGVPVAVPQVGVVVGDLLALVPVDGFAGAVMGCAGAGVGVVPRVHAGGGADYPELHADEGVIAVRQVLHIGVPLADVRADVRIDGRAGDEHDPVGVAVRQARRRPQRLIVVGDGQRLIVWRRDAGAGGRGDGSPSCPWWRRRCSRR